jgi:phosphoglycolate phosphatase-like HAD superfamily hydrolase
VSLHGRGIPLAVLFDIDGTLIVTGGAGARAWHHAFESLFHADVDITKFSESGQTDPEVARSSFRGALGRDPDRRELAQLLGAYLDALPEEVGSSEGYRVLPGVLELLPRLRDCGVLLGITSGNVEAAAHIKIARARLNRFFSFGGYGSDSNDRIELTRRAIKRAEMLHGEPLDPMRCEVVGDTPRDVTAAHGAGAIAVAVATGAYSVDQLRETGAEHVVATLVEPFPGMENAPPARPQ